MKTLDEAATVDGDAAGPDVRLARTVATALASLAFKIVDVRCSWSLSAASSCCRSVGC